MLKNKLRFWLAIFLCTLILALTIGYFGVTKVPETIPPELRDNEWLNKDNCPGCWRELKLGETSQKETLSFVRTLSFVGGPISTATKPGGFLCKKPADANCVIMMFDKGKVTRIDLVLNYEVTFEQAVEKLGAPDNFSVTPMHIDDFMLGCMLQLLWKQRQMILETIESPKYFGKDLCVKIHEKDGLVPKGIPIQNVIYLQKEDIDDKYYSLWKGFSD